MDEELKRPRGRPALPPGDGKRHPLGIRTTARLARLIEEAARESGRSVAQEIEYRLEKSFLETEPWGGARSMAAFHSLAAQAIIFSGEHPERWLRDRETLEAVLETWRTVLRVSGIAPALKEPS
jgi:hypothetical protein